MAPVSELRNRLEAMVEMMASTLLGYQVALPTTLANSAVDNAPALRVCGDSKRYRLERRRLTVHPEQPALVKIPLNGDSVPSAEARQRSQQARAVQSARLGLSGKIRRYLTSERGYKLRRIAGFLSGRLRDRLTTPQGRPNPCGDKAWAEVAGLNFVATPEGLRCLDHGGIFEPLLTSHWTPFPSQVGADQYTTACATWLFHRQAERSGERRWQDGLEAARRYFAAFHSLRRQRLEHDHREFMVAPLTLALGAEAAAPFAGWTDYDPVNVFALRFFNSAVAASNGRDHGRAIGSGGRWLRRWLLWVIARNQTGSGLIRDSFRGTNVCSADTTYHHYALAMLCAGNSLLRERAADRLIRRGLAFSLAGQLANGEVCTYGRAANNIYHHAAFIAAACYGRARLGLDTGDAIARAVARLEAFRLPDGAWPTAMNHAPAEAMVGWHGGNLQYGALSALLLAMGADWLAEVGEELDPPLPQSPAPPPAAALPPPHTVLRRGGVELALTVGGDRTPWANGHHETGYAGITGWTVDGGNRWLTNERVTQETGEARLLADIQHQDRASRARLREIDPAGASATLTVTRRSGRGRYHYRLTERGFAVDIVETLAKTAAGAGPLCYALPLALPGARLIKTPEGTSIEAATIEAADGTVILLQCDRPVELDSQPVSINCQGPGVLITVRCPGPALTLTLVLAGPTEAQEPAVTEPALP